MGKRTRQTFSKDFKAKVALEALREESTVQEIAVKSKSDYKRAIEGLSDIFERPNKKSEEEKQSESEKDELLRIIGTQKIENNFLKKSTVRFTEQSHRFCRFSKGKIVNKAAM